MEVRLVIIGKTGSGKSSLANTILGGDFCKPKGGMNSGTEKCDFQHVTRNKVHIQVTDTPGVCDSYREAADVRHEISKSLATVTPGPHAVIMVLKTDRFTKEESDAYDELKNLFGPGITEFMIVAFTKIDDLGDMSLTDLIQEAPQKVRDIIAEAQGRFFGFNNKLPMDERVKQGEKLVRSVLEMQKRPKSYFTDSAVEKMTTVMSKEAQNRHVDVIRVKEIVVREEEEDKSDRGLFHAVYGVPFQKTVENSCSVM